uniref:Endoplasmic reticulum junction formation protein lunapark n=2 Tax=Spongospora subterranea TaxID=70186 RepID=A0A0H5QVU6_9EUKA|eukprot:CRZ05731.1 hypothetical protein [Spongospora subterranea]
MSQAATTDSGRSGFEDISRIGRDRGLVDRICDYLLADGPSNRYALICYYCYTHNGLVVREDLDRIRYMCSYCGVLNERAPPSTSPEGDSSILPWDHAPDTEPSTTEPKDQEYIQSVVESEVQEPRIVDEPLDVKPDEFSEPPSPPSPD